MASNIFDSIYETNKWGGEESLSGPGAGTVAIENIAGPLVDLVEDIGAESVLDVGCGDGFWMPELPGYIGIDVSARAVELHRQRHPHRDIRLDDGSEFPMTDLTIVRCVMQHLSYDDIRHLLSRIRSPYLLATTNRQGWNTPIETGGGFWIDLQSYPFGFPEPIRTIKDGHSDHVDKDNILGLWKSDTGFA